MKGHYLMVVLPDGKEAVRREYLPLAREDETVEEATERWLDSKVAHRVRNVAKARAAVEREILSRKLCRPTRWHRENGTGAFAPPGTAKSRRRGR